jgi:hypothetical protein
MNATRLAAALAACVSLAALALPAHAVAIQGATVVPLVTAGAPPDSPAARVDPNTAASPFSGVVSINIRYDGQSFICSGTLVSKRDVVTAGHCVDTNGNGKLIDITAPGADVRVVFNASTVVGSPGRAIVTADKVSMNPNYEGFGNCPSGVPGFCVNDDIAVVHLSQDAPPDAKIYRAFTGDVTTGQLITMVGYGTSGDGINGYTIGPDFRIKRSGQNVIDLFDLDDEQNFAGGPKEVWYADFDGGGQDTFCTLLNVCTPVLANDKEANIGGGDSGGPSFLFADGEYFLLGTNTFGGTLQGQNPGAFGTYFGGMLIGAYADYLEEATMGAIQTMVPEPETYALMLAGLAAVGVAARRRRRA